MSHAVQSPPQVRFDAETHRYYLGETRLHSVSSIIKQVWPLKKSFDGKVDPQTLENARERGILVDRYATEYIRTGEVTTDVNERDDIKYEYLPAFVEWWNKQDATVPVTAQVILHDATNEVAGTADLIVGDCFNPRNFFRDHEVCIYDIKCTSQEEVDWQYQLGAYGYMLKLMYPVEQLRLAVIHINPKRYSKGGLRIIPYDTNESIRRWGNIVQFWSDCRPWLDEVQRKSLKDAS